MGLMAWECWKGNLHINVDTKEMTTTDNDKDDDSSKEIGALEVSANASNAGIGRASNDIFSN